MAGAKEKAVVQESTIEEIELDASEIKELDQLAEETRKCGISWEDLKGRTRSMSFRVRLNKDIRSIILSLPRSHQEKIGKLIDRLSENPYPSRTKFIDISSTNFDIKKCKGHQTRFRVRIGEYRLIYQIEVSSQKILILKLDTRGDIY